MWEAKSFDALPFKIRRNFSGENMIIIELQSHKYFK